MTLELHIVVLTKKIEPPFENLFAFFLTLAKDSLRHLRTETAGGSDEPFVILQYEFFVDARIFAVEALDISERTQLDEVLISFGILSQHELMVAFILLTAGERLLASVLHYIKFAAYYRLERGAVGQLVLSRLRDKLKHAEHIAVIGDGDAFHTVLGRLLEHGRNISRPV